MVARYLIGIAVGACIGAVMGYYGKCTSGTCPLTANPYRGAIYGSVLGVLFVAMSGRTVKSGSEGGAIEQKRQTEEMSSKTVGEEPEATDEEKEAAGRDNSKEALLHIENREDFDNYVLKASKPCLADFYSHRCPPCTMLAPVVEKLAEKYHGRAVVCKVNLDVAPNLAAPYEIMGIPAVLFFRNGEEIHRLIGLRSQQEYEQVLDQILEE